MAGITLNILDNDEARDKWYNETLGKAIKIYCRNQGVAEADVTKVDKMYAVCGYVLSNIKYYPNDGERLIFLTSDVGRPIWEGGTIDCIDATGIMRTFAAMLGLESKSTYAGYLNHYFATVYIDGEAYEFDACPLSDGNIVTSWDYVME